MIVRSLFIDTRTADLTAEGFERDPMRHELRCDGRAYWPWRYPRLFRRIGYAYGRRRLRFRVPDHRSAFEVRPA